jgi:hypothetical protein
MINQQDKAAGERRSELNEWDDVSEVARGHRPGELGKGPMTLSKAF